MSLPPTIIQTTIWQRTLADAGDEYERPARAQLRVAFEEAREKARKLAEEIPRYLPEFTDHSVDHMDSLWRIADHILPEDYPLNPAEAFVFGCAILVHDCAMSVAAYPGRMDEIRRHPIWRDVLAQTHREMRRQRPKPEELDAPGEDVEQRALGEFLRRNHAAQAEKLPLQAWTKDEGTYYLISNERLREHFGYAIGVAAHSHHWSVDRLINDLPIGPGPLPGLLGRWDIDTLMLACLLRVADACHLDERRAPSFSFVLRDLPPESAKHWDFQNRLNLRVRQHDSLVFVSTRPFPVDKAPVWWLAYDTLCIADRELSTVDAMLREHGRQPFAARRIQGATSPLELARYVKPEAWKPIDARVHIGDVPSLVERLGGTQLYGHRPEVALRELVQNAADAVRTRRILEKRPDDWGEVTVWFAKVARGPDRGWWLHVRDNGVGMTERCLSEYLLNFGASYWRSSLAATEHTGLLGEGVEHAGVYGVGFFSVFMLGEQVRVTTRFYRGDGTTNVLEFGVGLRERPLLRHAAPSEALIDPGTEIAVLMAGSNTDKAIYAADWQQVFAVDTPVRQLYTQLINPVSVLEKFFPASDVTINYVGASAPTCIIKSNDWIDLEPAALLRRADNARLQPANALDADQINKLSTATSTLYFSDGQIAGRLVLVGHLTGWQQKHTKRAAVVTNVGGILISEADFDHNVIGIVRGEVTTISRESGYVCDDNLDFASWAADQEYKWHPMLSDVEQLALFYEIRRYGVTPHDLPMVICNNRTLHEAEFRNYLRDRNELDLVINMFGPVEPAWAMPFPIPLTDHIRKLAIAHQVCSGEYIYLGASTEPEHFPLTPAAFTASAQDRLWYVIETAEEVSDKRDRDQLPMGAYIIHVICDTWCVRPRSLFGISEASYLREGAISFRMPDEIRNAISLREEIIDLSEGKKLLHCYIAKVKR